MNETDFNNLVLHLSSDEESEVEKTVDLLADLGDQRCVPPLISLL
jgi:hypothetical protein